MEIQRPGSRPSTPGSTDWFTGSVRVDPLFAAQPPSRLAGNIATFEAGARTAWHTHPLGQVLIVVSGCGWAQTDGGAVQVIRPGDVVRFGPGERHWHGATSTTAMSHIALQEAVDGIAVLWQEPVAEADYVAAPEA